MTERTSLPTPDDIAEWCHQRRQPETPNLSDLLLEPVSASAGDDKAATPPQRLLGIWAHPDDEAYLAAGLMARTVDNGGEVTLLALTDGEEGFPSDDPRPALDRAKQRRSELRAAMATIGVTDVRFLGIPDGAVAHCDKPSVVDAIYRLIDDVNPDVIVTFGPDGITGHEDHIANSELVTQAWLENRCGELWYAAKTTDWLDSWRDLHDQFGVWMTEEPTGVAGDEIEFIVDMQGAELSRKRAVLAAHESQTAGLSAAFGEDRYRRWISEEAFRFPTETELASMMTQMTGEAVLVTS